MAGLVIFIILGWRGYGAHREDRCRCSPTELLGFGNDSRQVEPKLIREIGLVEQDYGARPAFTGQGEIALDPTRVVVSIQPADDKQHVNVGGKHLFESGLTRLFAREPGSPLEHADNGWRIAAKDHPIAHARPLASVFVRAFVPKLS